MPKAIELNKTIIKIPAAISKSTEIADVMYDAMCNPLSLKRANAAYTESKKMLITAHQIVHKSDLFHSTTYEMIPKL